MPFKKQVRTKVQRLILTVAITRVVSDEGVESVSVPRASITTIFLDQDGVRMKEVDSREAWSHFTNPQKNGLVTLMDAIRTKIIAELVG